MSVSKITILILFLGFSTNYAQENKSYLDPPKIIESFGANEKYHPENRTGTGIPSIAISKNGRLWAVWYAGITKGNIVERCPNNYVVISTSDDNGNSWEEVLVIDPDEMGPIRAFDPEIWFDPQGKLWIFWAQQIRSIDKIKSGVWAITTEEGDNSKPNWSAPRRLADGVMMCKPTVLNSGEWVLPVSYWHKKEESARVIVSNDKGKHWHDIGFVKIPLDAKNFDEHMVIEKSDGTLSMWVRTNYGIGESTSTDRGKTWSTLKKAKVSHTSSRFFLRKLRSGKILLVKHGPISIQTGRSHLMAFISEDDGQSWSNGLLIDGRSGVSYPDGDQSEDGTIFLTYDYSRNDKQHILMTSFKEDDILASTSDISIWKVYNNRKIISDGGR